VIGIQDIESKLQVIRKTGTKMPGFAYVNPAVIHNIFYDSIGAGHVPNSHYGHSGFSIWTFCGKIELVPMHTLLNDEVIFSNGKNIVLSIMFKMGLDNV
jgi:hypothetical protein